MYCKWFIHVVYVNAWVIYLSRVLVNGIQDESGVPQIIVPVKAVLVPFGGYVKLTCHVTGPPPINISWMKRNRPLESNSNKFHIEHIPSSNQFETLLIGIKNISNSDVGVYSCFAENSFGTMKVNATLYGFFNNENDCGIRKPKTIIDIRESFESRNTSRGSTFIDKTIPNIITLLLICCLCG